MPKPKSPATGGMAQSAPPAAPVKSPVMPGPTKPSFGTRPFGGAFSKSSTMGSGQRIRTAMKSLNTPPGGRGPVAKLMHRMRGGGPPKPQGGVGNPGPPKPPIPPYPPKGKTSKSCVTKVKPGGSY